ncbi:MAG: hypothetical protein RBT69_10965 [Spirochaetia bacterium]|jgi:predicted permease|nr:hypothetical protein [Spirochaetia bacterium]
MGKILFSLAVVFSGLTTGYVISAFFPLLSFGSDLNVRARKNLQRTALLVLNPIAFVGSLWILDLNHIELFAMPMMGILAISTGGAVALLIAKIIKLSRRETGSFFCCGAFTNIGSIGALVCYAFLGEKGFALVPLYKIFEEFSYYSIGFPIAKSYSESAAGVKGQRKNIFKDPFVLAALFSIASGFILNLSGLKRPEILGPVNALIIPAGSFILLVSIGMAMQFRRMKGYIWKALTLLPLKHLFIPALTFTAALIAGLGNVEDALPLKVVLILAAMPVAFTALIPPSIYDLDIDFANTCWLISTGFMVVTVPVLMVLISLF